MRIGGQRILFCKISKVSRELGYIFLFTLKNNEFVQYQKDIWIELTDLGLVPIISFFVKAVKFIKTPDFFSFKIASKWKRKHKELALKEG